MGVMGANYTFVQKVICLPMTVCTFNFNSGNGQHYEFVIRRSNPNPNQIKYILHFHINTIIFVMY